MSKMKTDTLAKEYQALIYGLFQEKLFSLDGVQMDDAQGIPETYIPKSIMMDKVVELLNELGRAIATDRRLSDEIDPGENDPVSEEAETGEQLPA